MAELYAGLREPSFRAQRVTLLQLLANKYSEETQPTEPAPLQEIISFCLTLVATLINTQAAVQREELAHYALSVLVNITTTEANQKLMIELIIDETKLTTTHWLTILKAFLDHDASTEKQQSDTSERLDASEFWIREDYLHLTSFVLCNLSQHEEVRTQLTRRSLGYVPKLLSQIKSRNGSRRHGSVGAVRK